MTVGELIARLSVFDLDAEVGIVYFDKHSGTVKDVVLAVEAGLGDWSVAICNC
jgi:hypothetical protein